MQGGGTLGSVPLPAHKVTPHDVVELRPSKGDASQPAIANGIVHRYARLMRGHISQAASVCSSFTQRPERHWQLPDEGKLNSVVCFCRVKDTCIIVAVEEMPDEGLDQPLRVDKLANEVLLSANQISSSSQSAYHEGKVAFARPCGREEFLCVQQVTYRRLRETVEALGGAQSATNASNTLVDVLFGCTMPRFAQNPPAWAPRNARLDASQRRAVARALAAKDIALIHGPPGTGKTTAVVELILQEAARGNKVTMLLIWNCLQ